MNADVVNHYSGTRHLPIVTTTSQYIGSLLNVDNSLFRKADSFSNPTSTVAVQISLDNADVCLTVDNIGFPFLGSLPTSDDTLYRASAQPCGQISFHSKTEPQNVPSCAEYSLPRLPECNREGPPYTLYTMIPYRSQEVTH